MNPEIRPPNGTRVETNTKHPSRGGTPWSQEIRDQVICMYDQNLPLNSEEIQSLRAAKRFPCHNTCQNWIKQYLECGHAQPKRRTGNKYSTREIQGVALERLALFFAVKPKGTSAECRAYLYNMDPSVKPYSDSQVSRAKALLSIRRKVASTTATKAYLPENLQKRHLYWNAPPPMGMAGVKIENIIDLDEAGFKVEQTTSRYGYAARQWRCTDTGVYGHGKRVNLLLAICGDPNLAMRWCDCWTDGGTTLERFIEFIDMILDDLAANHPGRQFTFTMDNLNVHRSPIILAMILGAGHQLVFRAPYWPVDGAVEYVFNTIHSHLYTYNIGSLDELRNRLLLLVGQIPSFYKYFVNVGFYE